MKFDEGLYLLISNEKELQKLKEIEETQEEKEKLRKKIIQIKISSLKGYIQLCKLFREHYLPCEDNFMFNQNKIENALLDNKNILMTMVSRRLWNVIITKE